MNNREGITRRRVEVVEAPCMLLMKKEGILSILIKEINFGAGRKKVVFVGEREATNISWRNFERGEGSGLGIEKGGKGFTMPVTALWLSW